MRRAYSIAVLVLAALAPFAQPALAQTEAPPCLVPDALLQAGFADDAKTAYREVLDAIAKDDTEEAPAGAESCAKEGLARAHATLVATHVAVGDLYRASDDKSTAADHYEEALELSPTSTGAIRGVELLREAKVPAIERARSLSQLGEHEKALEVLNEAMASDEGLRDKVPDELAYLYDGDLASWDSFHRNLDPWARPIIEIAIGLVVVLVLIRLVAAAFGVVRRRLEIEDFDKGGFDEEYFGKFFATEVRGRLQHLAKGSGRGRINLVAGPIEAVDLPSQIEGILPSGPATWFSPLAWVKAIPALLFFLLPRKTVKLSGFLHDAGERGVGATVQLAHNDKVVETYTAWEKEFDKQRPAKPDDKRDGLEPLAEYVAVWLLFHMNKHLRSEQPMLGTWKWKSYALFRAGIRATDEERTEDAKAAYLQALEIDPKLRGARFNLGRILANEGNDKGALEQFLKVREEASQETDADRDPTLYSAEYNIAVATRETSGAATALPLVSKLLDKVDATLSLTAREATDYEDPTLRAHLLKIQPVIRVTVGGLKLETGDPGGLRILEEEAAASDLSAQVQYALACAYTAAARTAKDPADAERHAKRSLEFLGGAIKLEPKLAELVNKDDSLTWLRDHESDAVDALVASLGATPDESVEESNPLAEYTAIGDENAKQLKEADIDTPAELLQKTIQPADRTSLAGTLGVGTPLVTAWAHAMDLMRIVGMKPAHVNLLALAGVGGLAELGAEDPAHLAELLTGLGKATGESEVPDAAAVKDWVNDARTNTKPKVF